MISIFLRQSEITAHIKRLAAFPGCSGISQTDLTRFLEELIERHPEALDAIETLRERRRRGDEGQQGSFYYFILKLSLGSTMFSGTQQEKPMRFKTKS